MSGGQNIAGNQPAAQQGNNSKYANNPAYNTPTVFWIKKVKLNTE